MVVKRRKPKPLLIIIIILLIFFSLFLLFGYLTSSMNYKNKDKIEVEITSGISTSEIASILKEKKLIKSKLLFTIYVKAYNVKLKAATYIFNQSMDLKDIIDELEKGSLYNPNLVKLTFKEGMRITDYAKVISEHTNNSYENTISQLKDTNFIKGLINKYWFLTDRVLDVNIYYPLEGYLSPDTYYFDNRDVKIEEIIEAMLKQMEKRLEKYKNNLNDNVHEILTMASIAELEGKDTKNRKMIVGVFNNRIKKGMNLGSDVTTYYGLQAAMKSDLTSEEFASDNPYNTRAVSMIGKMPIGPICNPSDSSIEASISPTENDYLFFVADKNGNIFYTKTNIEHDQKVAEIKAKGDWIW